VKQAGYRPTNSPEELSVKLFQRFFGTEGLVLVEILAHGRVAHSHKCRRQSPSYQQYKSRAYNSGFETDLDTLWRKLVPYPVSSVLHMPEGRTTLNPIVSLSLARPTLIPSTLMSSTTASPARFQSILDAAFDSYAKQTGVELAKHPSAYKLQNCHSPDDVLRLLLEKETAFQDYRDKHRKLTDSLRPVVQVVHKFSAAFGEVAGFVRSGQRIHLPRSYLHVFLQVPFQPAKAIFVGIDVLLSVHIYRHLSHSIPCVILFYIRRRSG